MLRPMRSLALGVAITDGHTRLTRLETDASLHAAFGAADVCHHCSLAPKYDLTTIVLLRLGASS